MQIRIFFLVGLIPVLTNAQVIPKEIDNFAKSEGLIFNEKNTDEDGFSYRYTCKKSDCGELVVYYSNINDCVVQASEFGDLMFPLDSTRKAIFTISSITDKNSQARDYLKFVNKNKKQCVEISYGYQGDKFEKIVGLAKKL